MNGSQNPLSASGPIDLAREDDFRLGALAVRPSSREVQRGDWREQLEPRVMQVLVALAQAGGRVVSRDDLIARCWEGRVVGEDAINRAIGRLRRLSESDSGASFEIETILRVGYRLNAKDADRSDAIASASSNTAPGLPAEPPLLSPSKQAPSVRHHFVIASVLAILLVAGMAWLLWPAPRWVVESSRPFLSTLALEDYPAFSPNSAMLAYSSGPDGGDSKIYVRGVAGGDGIRISNDSYDDISPTWSSDGARVAYIAIEAGRPCHIMVATVPAGAVREAGRCRQTTSSSVTWQPGTSYLYFEERNGLIGDIIYRLDVDSGAQQAIVKMPQLNQVVSSPRSSPDGKWLAYLVLRRGILIRNLASGAEKTLGSIARHGVENGWLTWSADSSAVFAAISGGTGSEVDAFPVDGSPSYRVYATALRIGRVAAGDKVLALETDISRVNLARPVGAGTDRPDVLDAASGYTWSPDFASDGTLAFLSNRSGSNAIWLMKPGGAPVQLYDGGFAPLERVRFSPDGSRLALVTTAPDGVDIKILSRNGASLSSFAMPSLGLGLPTWTPDGRALLVFDRRDKRTWRIMADNPSQRSVFAPLHWTGVAVRPQGTFATRADLPGIWRIDGAVTRITAKYPAFYNPPMAFKGADVLVPDYPQGSTPRILAQPLSGGPDAPLGYAPGAFNRDDFQVDYAVNPVTGTVAYTALVARDTNIDLLTLAKHYSATLATDPDTEFKK
jgi:Tol biopolymer transport system component/DNA-binding winged helix-turn-helix (wHTH) protein